jgi:hypothetical protein
MLKVTYEQLQDFVQELDDAVGDLSGVLKTHAGNFENVDTTGN